MLLDWHNGTMTQWHNDSTTSAKLRAEVKHEIEDIKEINHTKKN